MHTKEIQVFKIAQTRVNPAEVDSWLRAIGVKDVLRVMSQLATTADSNGNPPVATHASALVALCGKRCYNSFEAKLNPNVTKIREDHAEYMANVLSSGHGSVAEHCTWTFAVEGLSRVATAEINRHRAGVAISEASMRYIRFDDIGFWMPSSLKPESCAEDDDEVKMQKVATSLTLKEAFTQIEKLYVDLCNIWKIEEMTDFKRKKELTSMFRRIVGMGVATGAVYTFNARALRWILQLRTTEHAEEEIREVFDKIANIIVPEEPNLFGDFGKNEKGEWVPQFRKV